jgi:dTMP kinase
MFITLEGPEGSGKSTQMVRLAEWLEARGIAFLATREPGGTDIGNQIRQVLMATGNLGMTAETEFLLFSASRAQIVRDVIRPALEAGKVVLCDRFYDSSLAYQGYGRGLEIAVLQQITRFATGGLTPDLTLLLDIDVEQGLHRRRRAAQTEGAEWTRLDAQTVAFHQRVREGYHTLAAENPTRWRIIDAGQEAEQVQLALRKVVETALSKQL